MKNITHKIISTGSAIMASAIAFTAKAQTGQGSVGGVTYQAATNISTKDQILTTMTNVANFLGTFVIGVSILTLLYAGFKFLTAGENEDAISAARRMITWGIVGIVVALLAFSVAPIIRSFLGY